MFKKSGKKSTKQKTTKETSDPNKKCSEEFTGIQNKGATCYLNALLQTLYMSNEVKDAVIRLKNRTKANKKAKQMSIAYQLAVLFEELENKRTGNTNKITEVLGINVTKQQDVAEHFQQILNKLAEDRNSHNILQNAALQDFFKTVILDGDNLCYCDTCQKKTKATMRYRCEILPQILVLQLKRFEFDYSMKSFKKLHNKVEIPQRLKFQKNEKVGEPEWIPYSTKSEESSKALRKQQSSSGAESGKRSKSKEVEEKQNLQLDGSQRIFTTYKLFATCDHKGEFGFGHYVAHIRPDTSNKWYNFNDTYVSEVENFFPEVRQNNTESMPCRRSSEAYLLMYRKENMNSNQDVTNAEEGAERIKAQRLHDGKSNYQTETNDRRKMAECEKTEENQMEDLPRKRHKNSIFSCFSGLNDESEIN
ncbi:ubiquitin carboxyl-terminal hydrolase 48-like isoform X3 [Hypanus sabinus]|uniref:ubiquitin carboxyl-terminal hydrolase 48-like isoform X3 n=1 Tax=Hypanus sabinus TaxID=79690 RepID=UPI0028C4933E|nr:ubiquitin carboxyl-terminal hydrolase 48-like isoform X3 [Hypanus sabinus]